MYISIRPRQALLYLGPLPLVAEADEGPSGRVIIVSPFLARNWSDLLWPAPVCRPSPSFLLLSSPALPLRNHTATIPSYLAHPRTGHRDTLILALTFTLHQSFLLSTSHYILGYPRLS